MTESRQGSVPVAVVGMSCRMPGADNLDEFWDLLREGRSAIRELPPDRFDRDLYYDSEKGRLGRSYTQIGGVVAHRPFDRTCCHLPDDLVDSSDISHLTMCEVAAEACRDAGLDPLDLPERNVGVYIGHTAGTTVGGSVTVHGTNAISANARGQAHFWQQRLARTTQIPAEK